jgi:hypothetical protein
MAEQKRLSGPTRREVVKKAAYVAPVVLTLAVSPSFAGRGSGPERPSPKDPKPRKDPKPSKRS